MPKPRYLWDGYELDAIDGVLYEVNSLQDCNFLKKAKVKLWDITRKRHSSYTVTFTTVIPPDKKAE